MRRSGDRSGGRAEFPIGPILVYYGGESPEEDLGPKPYKCPFHGDSHASATVNTEEGWFNCFANDCPKGNAVQIIMKAEGVDYGSAVERAAEISGGSNPPVRQARGRSGGVSRSARNRQGTRRFNRNRGSA